MLGHQKSNYYSLQGKDLKDYLKSAKKLSSLGGLRASEGLVQHHGVCVF